MRDVGYRSIFLAEDWQHVAYLGWQDSWPCPGFRVMQQKRGIFRRIFVMSELGDPGKFKANWDQHVGDISITQEVCLHDFSGSPEIAELLESKGLLPLTKEQRMLNIATIVISLDEDLAALRANLSSDIRRKLRKAEDAGLQVVEGAAHLESAVPEFILSFNKMAEERSLQPINARLVRKMIADGKSRLLAVRAPEGKWRNFLLTYESEDTGIFLQGAATGHDNDGAGQLLQWGTICALKAAGKRWYDMGGIQSTDSADGIYRFKKGFGGQVIDLGREYGKSGLAYSASRKLAKTAMSLKSSIG